MTLAITGATGQLGQAILSRLTTLRAGPIVALARNPARLAGAPVEARAADYAQPHMLDAALKGVETLLLISSSELGRRIVQHRNVIEAAQRAGVARLVYTSLLHADVSPIGLAAEHRETEAMIRASGLSFTILRNGWYSENFAGRIRSALESGELLGSAGDGLVTSASRLDYAAAAVAALTEGQSQEQILELAGDTAWSMRDLARIISQQSGRQIVYRDMPQACFEQSLVASGMEPAFARAAAGWDTATAAGALLDRSGQLSALVGRPTTPMAETVAGLVAR